MLYHHDSRLYADARDAAISAFQTKLNDVIEKGRSSALSVIDKIHREIPKDELWVAKDSRASYDDKGKVWLNRLYDSGLVLHDHAFGQICEKVDVPRAYVTKLMSKGDFGRALAMTNINTLMSNTAQGTKYLVRSVDGTIRGVLSDRYNRIDSRPVIDAFSKACSLVGAVPVEGVGGDTRLAIKALVPIMFRPHGDEVVAFGIVISNSDYGNGALSIRLFALRLWCTNYATLEEALREVHLGKRLTDEVVYSDKTYKLDAAATSSAVADTVKTLLSSENLSRTCGLIAEAASRTINPQSMFKRLVHDYKLLKSEAELVESVYTVGGIEQLPSGDNMYRMSNALSWVAQKAELPERKLELEILAGKLLTGKK